MPRYTLLLAAAGSGSTLIIQGNANANLIMTPPGTSLSLTGGNSDDGYSAIAIPFTFNYFGKNYGNGNNGGMFLSTNNHIDFGTGSSANNPTASIISIFIGLYDRIPIEAHASGMLTSNGYSYINLTTTFQNYPIGSGGGGSMQIRLFTNGTIQYIEVRCGATFSPAGVFQIANGTGTYATTLNASYSGRTSFTAGESFVLSCPVASSSTWSYWPNYHINI